MKFRWLIALTAGMAIALPIVAEPPTKPADTGKPKADAEVKHLYGLDWHTKLDTALKSAAGDGTTAAKPVMVLRVLGDLDGFM